MRGAGVGGAPHHAPPLANGGDGEGRRVVVAADADPGLVARHVVDGRPAPGRRPVAAPSPPTNSRRPLRILSRASPVAAATNASPPYPIAIDSAAAQRRRACSLSTGDITTNLATIVASRSSSRVTRGLDHIHHRKSKVILGRGLNESERDDEARAAREEPA